MTPRDGLRSPGLRCCCGSRVSYRVFDVPTTGELPPLTNIYFPLQILTSRTRENLFLSEQQFNNLDNGDSGSASNGISLEA